MLQFIQNLFSGVSMGLLYGMIGVGVVLFWQTTELINFAHISSAMFGAYLFYSFYVLFELPLLVAFSLAVIIVGLYGIIILKRGIYYPIVKRLGGRLEFIVATLMLSIFTINLVIVIWGGVPKPPPKVFGHGAGKVNINGISISWHEIWVIMFVVILVVALNYFFKKTLTGKCLRATAQDKDTASLMGIKVDKMLNISFSLSTGVTAIAGILLSPVYFVSLELGGGIIGIKGFASAVIGGLTNPYGALIGGMLIGITENIAVLYMSSRFRDVFSFALLIIFLVMKPKGIFERF